MLIAPLLTTLWDHMDACANKYHCECTIYLLTFIALEFHIIIDRVVVAPGHAKGVVDSMNDRYKQMPKLKTVKLFNTKN